MYPSHRLLVVQGKEWNANASEAVKEPVLRVFAAVYMMLIFLSSAVTLRASTLGLFSLH